VNGSQSPSKGSAAKKKNDSATAQKEEDMVGFVSNKPIHKGQGRPTWTAPEFVMRFFQCKSLLPQALINKAEQKLHIGYHPLWIKGDTLTIVSHLKLARISVNTLDNVPSQDGDDDELVNLKDVDDDAA
jgi:hypothetical protein